MSDNAHAPEDAFRIALADGYAEAVGDGCFIIVQEGPNGTQTVAIEEADIRALLAAL